MKHLHHIIAAVIALAAPFAAANELDEAKRLAPKYNAEIEVRLEDGSRVDLLNEEYAIEIDWAAKHAEAVGQALFYSLMTDRKPAIILLVRDPAKEWRYLVRAALVCGRHDIRLYVEEVSHG